MSFCDFSNENLVVYLRSCGNEVNDPSWEDCIAEIERRLNTKPDWKPFEFIELDEDANAETIYGRNQMSDLIDRYVEPQVSIEDLSLGEVMIWLSQEGYSLSFKKETGYAHRNMLCLTVKKEDAYNEQHISYAELESVKNPDELIKLAVLEARGKIMDLVHQRAV